MSYLKEKQIRDGNDFLTDVISVRATRFWRSLLVLSLFISQFSFPPLRRPWGSFGFRGWRGGRWEQAQEGRGSPGEAASASPSLVGDSPFPPSQGAIPTSLPGAMWPPGTLWPWPRLYHMADAVWSHCVLAELSSEGKLHEGEGPVGLIQHQMSTSTTGTGTHVHQ